VPGGLKFRVECRPRCIVRVAVLRGAEWSGVHELPRHELPDIICLTGQWTSRPTRGKSGTTGHTEPVKQLVPGRAVEVPSQGLRV